MLGRVITVILGVIMIAAGISIMATPAIGDIVIALTAAIGAVVEGVAVIILWNRLRQVGQSSAFILIGGIISIVFGIFLLCGWTFRFVYISIIAVMLAIWLIAEGIMNISASLTIRKAIKSGQTTDSKASWGWVLAGGIIMLICGIFGIINPVSIGLALGFMVGISLLVSGVGVLVVAISGRSV